jgi:hypothetical protein
MSNAKPNLRSCPTRADGLEVLIAHSISTEICQERQRRLYHKCFTCALRGRAVAEPRGLPPIPETRLARPVGASAPRDVARPAHV